MKRFLMSIMFILLSLFMVGCIKVEDPNIIIDNTIEVYIDEDYTVLPVVEGIKDEVNLIFTSMDESIFKIEDGNKIIPVSVGESDLLIQIEKIDVEVSVKVIILDRVEEVELKFQNTEFSVLEGEELTLILLVNDEQVNNNVTWTSSNNSIASVSDMGVVHGISSGTVTITASYDNKELQAEVVVEENTSEPIITVTGIKDIEIDDIIMLRATFLTSTDSFIWTSLNENVATITSGGILQGISAGTASIKVSLKDNPSINLTFNITVKTPILDITVSPSSEIVVGSNENILIVRDSKGIAVSRYLCEYKSLNENIVTVNNEGVITAVGVGTTSIEVKNKSAIGTVVITVTEAPEINYRNLIVEKAIGEEGYIEGSNNDTIYGTWYGMPNQPWCAMFVSWSAYQVGIPNTIIPKYASVALGLEWFRSKGSDFYKSYEETQNDEYTPIAGDIVFFKSNGASHTGLVIKVVGDIMYTIEGNTSNRVALRFYYYKNYDKITGYGIPNYQASSTPIKNFDITKATFGGGISTQ